MNGGGEVTYEDPYVAQLARQATPLVELRKLSPVRPVVGQRQTRTSRSVGQSFVMLGPGWARSFARFFALPATLSAGAPEYRWDVFVKGFTYQGGSWWSQVHYSKSPAAPLTVAEICAWLSSLPGKTILVAPGSGESWQAVVGPDPVVKVVAWDAGHTSTVAQYEGVLWNVKDQIGCG